MKKIISFIVVLAVIVAAVSLASCESCSREMHSLRSDSGGGLDRREIVLDFCDCTDTTSSTGISFGYSLVTHSVH